MRQYTGFMQRLARNEAGNTLAIMAAAMIPFTILVGSGVDLAVTYMARGKLQNACDAGVLAARQSMEGTDFDSDVEAEANRFFNFNYPDGTAGSTDIQFDIEQDDDDGAQLYGTASASVPTTLMKIVGVDALPIAVNCDAKRDMGHNDVMLVLDVTVSMGQAPSNGGGTKIQRLREGAAGIYRGLASGDDGSIIRFGILPYSQTVNVARSLKNKDILREQEYVDEVQTCTRWGSCSTTRTTKTVNINDSQWNNGNDDDVDGTGGNKEKFRTSGIGCIEERPSVGNPDSPIRIEDTITRADIDSQAGNAGNEEELQFGRYDPVVQEGGGYRGCPAEATKLKEYTDESSFQSAINLAAADSKITGNTYHDIGMLWALRFISRTGFFSADNPTERDGIPVNQHIVYLTDGELHTDASAYSSHGIEQYQHRTQGGGSLDQRHQARFDSACDLAKSMGITVWVIALDVADTSAVEPCATSPAHFYTSDGSNLEEVFEKIGRGIGNLRLTR